MGIASVFASYSDEYWDFKDAVNDGIHSIAHYPAPMVAPMQRELLSLLMLENPSYKRLLDPFHGSGVTLVEGQSIGLDIWGIDINPYAHIITNAKLEKYSPEIITVACRRISSRIGRLLKEGNIINYTFPNIEKWFRDDVICDLSVIRTAIYMEPNKKTRRYFWLCFGEIVKKYSNTRTSTFKLHIKEERKILGMRNVIISDFQKKIEETYKLIGYPKQNPYHLNCGDSINVMKNYKPGFFDIICTSPPYGDNATTVPYGQYSTLQLLWINGDDFKYDSSLLKNYSIIDSMSLGGAHSINEAFFLSPIVANYIPRLSSHKQTKVRRFYADYENAFRSMSVLLKQGGSLVLTLGNRMIDRIEFPFIEANQEMALHYGLNLVHVINRNIINKRMPLKVSRLPDGKPVDSMLKETVLLFKKESV